MHREWSVQSEAHMSIAQLALFLVQRHPKLLRYLIGHFFLFDLRLVPLWEPTMESFSAASLKGTEKPLVPSSSDGGMALYAAFLQATTGGGGANGGQGSRGADVAHPWGMRRAWAWMARALNQLATPSVAKKHGESVASLLATFFDIAGYELRRVYPRQTTKVGALLLGPDGRTGGVLALLEAAGVGEGVVRRLREFAVGATRGSLKLPRGHYSQMKRKDLSSAVQEN